MDLHRSQYARTAKLLRGERHRVRASPRSSSHKGRCRSPNDSSRLVVVRPKLAMEEQLPPRMGPEAFAYTPFHLKALIEEVDRLQRRERTLMEDKRLLQEALEFNNKLSDNKNNNKKVVDAKDREKRVSMFERKRAAKKIQSRWRFRKGKQKEKDGVTDYKAKYTKAVADSRKAATDARALGATNNKLSNENLKLKAQVEELRSYMRQAKSLLKRGKRGLAKELEAVHAAALRQREHAHEADRKELKSAFNVKYRRMEVQLHDAQNAEAALRKKVQRLMSDDLFMDMKRTNELILEVQAKERPRERDRRQDTSVADAENGKLRADIIVLNRIIDDLQMRGGRARGSITVIDTRTEQERIVSPVVPKAPVENTRAKGMSSRQWNSLQDDEISLADYDDEISTNRIRQRMDFELPEYGGHGHELDEMSIHSYDMDTRGSYGH